VTIDPKWCPQEATPKVLEEHFHIILPLFEKKTEPELIAILREHGLKVTYVALSHSLVDVSLCVAPKQYPKADRTVMAQRQLWCKARGETVRFQWHRQKKDGAQFKGWPVSPKNLERFICKNRITVSRSEPPSKLLGPTPIEGMC